jgi:hypothetical protein
MVDNMWKNWVKAKATSPLDISTSLDEPLSGEGQTGIDLLKDPLALNFKSEVEAQIIESALLENIENPRHRELLEMWLSEDPRMGPVEKSKEVAEKYNKAHSEETPLEEYRVYRIMTNEIYPKVLDVFPERAHSVDYMRNPETGPGNVKWIKKPESKEIAPIDEPVSEDEIFTEEAVYAPVGEGIAPAYRINPQTGERTLISLNMKRKITTAQEAWCQNLLTFLSIEKYGKFKRSIKSSPTR